MSKTGFDLYREQKENGTFSAETKKDVYRNYQAEIRVRYLKRNQNKSYYTNPLARIHDEREQDPKEFYVRASQIRDAVLLDFELLESMMGNEVLFAQLTDEEKARIEYYHYDYATLLLDDVAVNNHDYDATNKLNVANKYQKIIKEYAEKNDLKEATSSDDSAKEQKEAKEKFKAAASISIEWGMTWFGLFNIYRLLITFLRYTWFFFIQIARSLRWLEALPFAVDADLLMAPTPIFNILSVFLFLGRLVFDVTMTLVHTFFPTEAEKGVNFVERFHMEWRKRHRRMVNDFAWSFFNAFTNFAWVFGIPVPVAGPLLVVFLAFDIGWFGYQWHQDEQAIKETESFLDELLKAQKEKKLGLVEKQAKKMSVSGDSLASNAEYIPVDDAVHSPMVAGSFAPVNEEGTPVTLGDIVDVESDLDEQISFTRLQLRELECRRAKTRATYLFCLAAATLLVISFALFLPFMASPLAAPLCFFACAFAVAMYINAGNVGKLWQSRYERYLSKDNAEGKCLDEDEFGLSFTDKDKKEAYQESRRQAERADSRALVFKFAESLIVSAVLIVLFTVNWPAALALTLTYILVKLVKSVDYKQVKNRFFSPAKATEATSEQPNANKLATSANDADGDADSLLAHDERNEEERQALLTRLG